MRIKTRLHRAFTLVVLSVLAMTGIASLALTQRNAARELDKELSQTSLLIYKIVKNVFDLNEKILLGNLGIVRSTVKSVALDRGAMVDAEAEHYLTRLTDRVRIPAMLLNGSPVFGDEAFVDELGRMTGGSVSVLQLFPQGLLQVATNIRRPDGTRATELYYPADHPVTRAIREGRVHVGKAFEMSEWRIVAYAPLYEGDRVVGALLAGLKPDIADLRAHILDIEIGRTGRPYIVDDEGILVVAAAGETENVYHLRHVKEMIKARRDGTVEYFEGPEGKRPGEKVIVNYRYLPEMGWIVAAGSYEREFYGDQEIITRIIVLSALVAFLVAVVASLQVADALTRPINFLTESMNAVKDLRDDFGDRAAVDWIKDRLRDPEAKEEEIRVMTETFRKMFVELDEARKQLVSKHRRYREAELSIKAAAILGPDMERFRGEEGAGQGQPAEEAAGCYFDRSPGPAGQTWYAIGDARERGLPAGLMMMMAQSAINSMAKTMPEASPAEFAEMVNRHLVEGLRVRAKADDFLALSILVTEPGGTFHYAGPHERLLVRRAGDGACEFLEAAASSRGPGTGGAAGSRSVRTLGLSLRPGDLLVLVGRAGPVADNEEGRTDREALRALVADAGGLAVEELVARLQEAERAAGRHGAAVFAIRKN